MRFTDVDVAPTQELMKVFGGPIFIGGPAFPDFESQVLARHCYGAEPRTMDERPREMADPKETIEVAVWCGPTVHHFGHTIADFGTRVRLSAFLIPDAPLLFSVPENDVENVPSYFWHVLTLLGVDHARIRLVSEPLHVKTLLVFPQAERLGGGGPSEDYLDFMTALTLPAAPVADAPAFAYVSRSRIKKGGTVAGERYIDEACAASGGVVLYPETIPLAEQLSHYRSIKKLVFTEGSAIHSLQLLGRTDIEAAIIMRRKDSRLAEPSLAPRLKSLTYIDAIDGCVFGVKPNGGPHETRGVALLDPEKLKASLIESIGVDIGRAWNERGFQKRCYGDFSNWLSRSRAAAAARGVSDLNEDTIRNCVRALSGSQYAHQAYANAAAAA